MRAAVAGRPIAHSLSPRLHRAAYAALGLDWSYEALDCGAGELAALLDRVRAEAGEWAGLSLTMPLKEVVLDHLDAVATDLGAVNTVVVAAGGRLVGENTDVDGIRAGLGELLGVPPSRSVGRAAVLGAGGTARAALAALASLGAVAVGVYVRDRRRGEAVAEVGRRRGLTVTVHPFGPPPAGVPVIATVPAGAADALPATGPLLDVGYDPWPTGYARRVAAAGLPVVGGRVVLLGQAARQVSLMTGREAPLAAMALALES